MASRRPQAFRSGPGTAPGGLSPEVPAGSLSRPRTSGGHPSPVRFFFCLSARQTDGQTDD